MTSNHDPAQQLPGGFMNTPVRRGNVVHRPPRENSSTIQKMLSHLHKKGITWIPEYLGTDDEGNEKFSYITGKVPHDMPEWIWNESILVDIAQKMRAMHDATLDFNTESCVWELPPSDPVEVICHNDFAPYNCVFANKQFVGLIDFDVCSPGSRVWDMAYAIYRFAPFMPPHKKVPTDETCPFTEDVMVSRINLFTSAYAGNADRYRYSITDVCRILQKRLSTLSEWTENYANLINNATLKRNARMYAWHAEWVGKYL